MNRTHAMNRSHHAKGAWSRQGVAAAFGLLDNLDMVVLALSPGSWLDRKCIVDVLWMHFGCAVDVSWMCCGCIAHVL